MNEPSLWLAITIILSGAGLLTFYLVMATIFSDNLLALFPIVAFAIVTMVVFLLIAVENKTTPPASAAPESTTAMPSPSQPLCPCPEATTEGPPQ
jgi:hypothetical protein